jgi:uncharacterized DUF497 family protein
MEYEWDWDNARHSGRHGVKPYQTREALEDPRGPQSPAYVEHGQLRVAVLGRTKSRRLVNVIYTVPRPGVIRVIAAWWGNKQDTKDYY